MHDEVGSTGCVHGTCQAMSENVNYFITSLRRANIYSCMDNNYSTRSTILPMIHASFLMLTRQSVVCGICLAEPDSQETIVVLPSTETIAVRFP